MPERRVGACIHVPLTGMPDAHWSTVLAGQLVTALAGHSKVGHLRFDGLVQGCEIVLEGVEDDEARELGPVLRKAVDATNRVVARGGPPAAPRNMDQEHADRIAADVDLSGDLARAREMA